MHRRLVHIAAGLGCATAAAGLGVLLLDRQPVSPPSVPDTAQLVVSTPAATSTSPALVASTRSATSTAAAAPIGEVVEAAKPAPDLAPDAGQRLETLRRRLLAAQTRGDGVAMVDGLLALSAAAPSDPRTHALAAGVLENVLSGRAGVAFNTFLVRVAGSEGRALLDAALERGDAPPLLRRFAAVHLAWMLPAETSLRTYERRLDGEQDPRVTGHLARAIVKQRGAAAVPMIERRYQRTTDPRHRMGLLEALYRGEAREAVETLRRFAQTETDPALRKLAADRVARRTAPVDGLRITRVRPGSQAAALGWRDGDIVVRVAGAALTTASELARVAQTDREVPIEIYRDGRVQAYRVDPRALGIAGTYVYSGA